MESEHWIKYTSLHRLSNFEAQKKISQTTNDPAVWELKRICSKLEKVNEVVINYKLNSLLEQQRRNSHKEEIVTLVLTKAESHGQNGPQNISSK
jgi:16S rRNA C1402 (ribose-2'-O) methylase RsmI